MPASLDERGPTDVAGAERLVTQATRQQPRTADQWGPCSILSAHTMQHWWLVEVDCIAHSSCPMLLCICI